MARGPDGKGGGEGFSLADQLFNADSLADLARDYAVLDGFDASKFHADALGGMEGRGLLERLEWIADCVEGQLPQDFGQMADALQRAMPDPLDPSLNDDDFGRFIHAVPGILAVRHGLEHHRERALDLLYEATQRFSMEFYIRPFLNRWPEETLARLDLWAGDSNYHVRRLVSEGTRPKLPWAKNITLDPAVPLRFLDRLYADPTRYVTRSVANHMNDLSKIMPEQVVARLSDWQGQGQQADKEMDWITRHALRTAVKRGERGALDLLGYRAGEVSAQLTLPPSVRMGDAVEITVDLSAPQDLAVMVDYRLRFARPSGTAEKVFKLKTGKVKADQPLRLSKAHRLKANASTFKLHPGTHGVVVQVNGMDVAQGEFEVLPVR